MDHRRAFRVEVRTPNAGGDIPSGISAEVRMPTEEIAAHFLSPAILSLNEDGQLGVKTVTGEGAVVFDPVEIVQAEAEGIWVTGLPAEARVITAGQGFVRAGETVRVGEAEASGEAQAPLDELAFASDAAAELPPPPDRHLRRPGPPGRQCRRDRRACRGTDRMRTLIEAAFSRSRTVVMLLALILAVGSFSYLSIPKESSPDIPVPTVYVSIAYSGIAPEDAERLLVRPLETELQSLEGVDELAATATEGYAALTLEFDAGFESTAPSSPSSWPTAAWPGARIDVPPMPMRRGAWPGR